jgi:hypothetical protein
VRVLGLALVLASALAWSQAAAAAPKPVTAWYMYGASVSDMKWYAYNHGCHIASGQPGTGLRILLLDFGAARKLDANTWGAVDFSNTRFSNSDILSALKRAADGYHDCHVQGSVDIVYGNSNYHLSDSGMSSTDAWYAGYHQSERAEDLDGYQSSQGYYSQAAEAASDMEPSWDGAPITKQLLNGDTAQGGALYYDYGSADGCPQSGSADGPCNNGWHVSDVAYVSFHGMALPLPEIYYTANAGQWTVVRKWWNSGGGGGDYFLAGVTASTGVGLPPQTAWSTLAASNSGLVEPELVCFGC